MCLVHFFLLFINSDFYILPIGPLIRSKHFVVTVIFSFNFFFLGGGDLSGTFHSGLFFDKTIVKWLHIVLNPIVYKAIKMVPCLSTELWLSSPQGKGSQLSGRALVC